MGSNSLMSRLAAVAVVQPTVVVEAVVISLSKFAVAKSSKDVLQSFLPLMEK